MRPSAMPQRRAGCVTPKLLCASRQPMLRSGQYIARSTTMPTSDVTDVDTSAAARRVSTSGSTLMVRRLFAGTTRSAGSSSHPRADRSRDVRRRRIRIAQEHEALEERAGRAFREEPLSARGVDAGRFVPALEQPASRQIHRALRDDRLHRRDVDAERLPAAPRCRPHTSCGGTSPQW